MHGSADALRDLIGVTYACCSFAWDLLTLGGIHPCRPFLDFPVFFFFRAFEAAGSSREAEISAYVLAGFAHAGSLGCLCGNQASAGFSTGTASLSSIIFGGVFETLSCRRPGGVTTGNFFSARNMKRRVTPSRKKGVSKKAKGSGKKRTFKKKSIRPSSSKVSLGKVNQAHFGPSEVESFPRHIKAVGGNTGAVKDACLCYRLFLYVICSPQRQAAWFIHDCRKFCRFHGRC